jgi:hypothetical protein
VCETGSEGFAAATKGFIRRDYYQFWRDRVMVAKSIPRSPSYPTESPVVLRERANRYRAYAQELRGNDKARQRIEALAAEIDVKAAAVERDGNCQRPQSPDSST